MADQQREDGHGVPAAANACTQEGALEVDDTADAGDDSTTAASAKDKRWAGDGASVVAGGGEVRQKSAAEAVAATPTRTVLAAEAVEEEEEPESPATPTLADWEISEVGAGGLLGPMWRLEPVGSARPA